MQQSHIDACFSQMRINFWMCTRIYTKITFNLILIQYQFSNISTSAHTYRGHCNIHYFESKSEIRTTAEPALSWNIDK